MTPAEMAVPAGLPDPLEGDLGYRTGEVLRLSGISYRMLDYLCREGHITETAGGSGTTRRFDRRDLDRLHLYVHLHKLGFNSKAALRVATELVDHDTYAAPVGEIFRLEIALASPLGAS